MSDDCRKVTYLDCCGARDAFSGRRGVEVVMMLNLPVIVLGCGKEDPSWLDKSAAVLIFAESHSKVQTLRFTGDPKFLRRNRGKRGAQGGSGWWQEGDCVSSNPSGPPSIFPILSFAVNQKLIMLQK